MAHDVFISHSVKDKSTADAVCATLEAGGIRCWIAPRDIVPGTDWGESIVRAISQSKLMILIFSSNANSSHQIKREVERAASKEVPIIPFRIEDASPSGALEYYLGTPHWLDAITPPLEHHLQQLAESVKLLLSMLPRKKVADNKDRGLSGSESSWPASSDSHSSSNVPQPHRYEPPPEVTPSTRLPNSQSFPHGIGSGTKISPKIIFKAARFGLLIGLIVLTGGGVLGNYALCEIGVQLECSRIFENLPLFLFQGVFWGILLGTLVGIIKYTRSKKTV